MSKIITVMDGSLASVRDRSLRTRVYTSDIVWRAVSSLKKFNHFKIFSGKGGIWRFWDRRLERYLREHNSADNDLICIGKSAGAYDTVKVLEEIDDDLKYRSVYLILIDPCHITKIFKRRRSLIMIPKCVKHCACFFQKRGILKGSIAATQSLKTYIDNVPIVRPDINHFNIALQPEVQDAIVSALEAE